MPNRIPRRPPRLDRHTARASLLGFFALVALGTPSAALADCMPPPTVIEALNTAEIAFVGTVVETSNLGRWANVAVQDVWRGPDQPSNVVVHGGPGGNVATSVDRAFDVGATYLFFPYIDPESGLSDNSCTNTQVFSDELAALRPTDARPPTGAPPAAESAFDLGGLAPLAVVAVVFAALLGVGLLVRGRSD